jgi:predicted dehydrogenase
MKKKKIKIIIVGLGQIGYLYNYNKNIISTHTQAIFSLKEKVDFFAVIEKKRRIRINFEKKFNVPALSKIEESKKIYDKSSDYLFILSTNTPTHYLILKKILKFKPKYILCEKPFCSNYQQAKKIFEKHNLYKNEVRYSATRVFGIQML